MPFLDVGFSRPLEKDGAYGYPIHHRFPLIAQLDLWELPSSQLTTSITNSVEYNFYSRCEPQNRPRNLRSSQNPPESLSPSSTKDGEGSSMPEKAGTSPKRAWFRKKPQEPKYDASLTYALHRTFIVRIWVAGILKLFSGMLAIPQYPG